MIIVRRRFLHPVTAAAAAVAAVVIVSAQQVPPQQARPPQQQQTPPGQEAAPRQGPPIDQNRAQQLYVSKDPKDHSPGYNYQRDIDAKVKDDFRYPELCKGIIDFKKITFRSSVGDMDIPAYLFQPLQKRGPKGHAAMVWVHGGVHGNWGLTMFPFVKEAVQRGYVIIAPEYRGSTGYGEAFHQAIDYGGLEVDDTISAADYLKTLPHVDADRIGIMGWSHGGYITLMSVFREKHPFKAAAAIVPVTNLVFRLSYKGPSYQRDFSTQKAVQGLPFEKRNLYIERSPLYHVDSLKVPLLVHVATNDEDVNYVQARSRGDEDLRGPGAVGQQRRARLQPARRCHHAGTGRFARPDRFVEPHLGLLRVEPAAVRGSVEAGAADQDQVTHDGVGPRTPEA
jgi:dipeptidyl aminopeptidase/acylaminoacyl peptidase